MKNVIITQVRLSSNGSTIGEFRLKLAFFSFDVVVFTHSGCLVLIKRRRIQNY